jgi:hypothetical protein
VPAPPRSRIRRLVGALRQRLRIGGAPALGAVALAVLVVAAITFVTVAIERRHAPPPVSSGTTAAPDPSASAAAARARCLGAAKPGVPACAGVDLGATVYPDPTLVTSDAAQQNDCYIGAHQKLTACHYGDTSAGALRVAVVGDSHAAALVPALLSQAQRVHWSVTTYVGDGCLLSTERLTGCDGAISGIISAVTEPGAYDLVVTTANRAQGGKTVNYTAMFRKVLASGASVAVVGDVPAVDPKAISCYQRIPKGTSPASCTTTRSKGLKVTDPLATSVRGLSSKAKFFDLTKYFCNSSSCPAVIGGMLVYRDDFADLTTTYSRTLGPFLVDAMRSQLKLQPLR